MSGQTPSFPPLPPVRCPCLLYKWQQRRKAEGRMRGGGGSGRVAGSCSRLHVPASHHSSLCSLLYPPLCSAKTPSRCLVAEKFCHCAGVQLCQSLTDHKSTVQEKYRKSAAGFFCLQCKLKKMSLPFRNHNNISETNKQTTTTKKKLFRKQKKLPEIKMLKNETK